MTVQLATPSARFHESFLQAAKEYQETGEVLDFDIKKLKDPQRFEEYVNFLRDAQDLDPPYAAKVYWLTEGDVYLGRGLIRHHPDDPQALTEGTIGYSVRPDRRREGLGVFILTELTREAERLGVPPRVAVKEGNTASVRTARRAGYVLTARSPSTLFFSPSFHT